MDAEIQFFMTTQDEEDFLEFVKTQVDSIEECGSVLKFLMGGCVLLFTPSTFEDAVIYMGRLEIRLGSSEADLEDSERAKSMFRTLRNWIKKKYFSRLAYLNVKKKNKLTPSRVHWLGPDAKQWKMSDPENNALKLSKTSWMVFEIGI